MIFSIFFFQEIPTGSLRDQSYHGDVSGEESDPELNFNIVKNVNDDNPDDGWDTDLENEGISKISSDENLMQ